MSELNGNEVLSTGPKRTQVFMATHDGAGNRLPLADRSFITFFYGERAIEDFNLIATISDRIQKPAYSNFNDITSSYEVVDGQFYWGTYLTTQELQFTLSTDAITEDELDDFKAWFKPGISRKFSLAENWNRYVYARVAAPPNYSLLPFEKVVTQQIGSETYTTSITEYRGDISLSLIVDDPLWRSNLPYFGTTTITPNSETPVQTLSSRDCLKTIYEDKVPYISMFPVTGTVLVANGVVITNQIAQPANTTITLNSSAPANLYYCGTAPAKPILSFGLSPVIDGTSHLISFPCNSYNESGSPYNTITVGTNTTQHKFRFTTPSIYTGYNQAITTAQSFSVGESFEELRVAMRDNINEYHARVWAMGCLAYVGAHDVNSSGALTTNFLTDFIACMAYFFPSASVLATFTINSKTGEAIGDFKIKALASTTNPANFSQTSDFGTYSDSVVAVENVGDMIKSEYLMIEGRSNFNEGMINVNTLIPVTFDSASSLVNFSLDYEYTYF